MPCCSRRRTRRIRLSSGIETTREETPAEMLRRLAESRARLEEKLTSGAVRVRIGPTGAVVFVGWTEEDKDGLTDVCAYRALSQSRSFALRRAVATAEAQQGTRVNEQAIASGMHSHDAGATWSRD